jgi:pilin isopeptide linkage protein
MKKLCRIMTAFLCLLSLAAVMMPQAKAGAYDTIKAVIPVSCLNVTDGAAHTYEIHIEQENPGSPMPSESSLKIEQSGKGGFTIDITEPGTYRYRIFEKAGNDPRINYDKSVYIATVFVQNGEGGRLAYSLSVAQQGRTNKPDRVAFSNEQNNEQSKQTTPNPVTSQTQVNPSTGNTAGNSLYAKILKISMLMLVIIAAVSFVISRRRDDDEQEDISE